MKRKSNVFTILLIILLFNVACVYSSFNVMVEADFLSRIKYETRDVEEVYAEKQNNLDAVLVSPTLFTPLPGIIFEFLSNFSSPNTPLTGALSVLRC
jgi:hypothetical protein